MGNERIYLGIGLSVWETAKIFGKWRRSVGNRSNMWGNVWETAKIFGNDVDLWEMVQICGEMT